MQQVFKTPESLERFTFHQADFAGRAHPKVEIPSAKISSLHLCGRDAGSMLMHCLRQGLNSETFRNLALSDFFSIGDFTVWNQAMTQQDRDAFANVEVLHLDSMNMVEDLAREILSLCPSTRSLVLESEYITEACVTDLVRSGTSKLESVLFRNCPKVSPNIVEWGKCNGIDIKLARQATPDLSVSQRIIAQN